VLFIPCGPGSWLLEVDDDAEAPDLAAHLAGTLEDAAEVVPAARTVLVEGVAEERLRAAVDAWAPGLEAPEGGVAEIPVTYDGEDLAHVAALWGVTEEQVVERHTGLELVSRFCGFAPGFAYLAGLPEEWAVPRLDSPRTRVPAGAVGLAGTWCGIYPTASPGGWQLIGRTEASIWDADRQPPALLAPGTRVRFVRA
jgi:KipI family sensor histidine kinase inhibitor